MWGPGVGPWCPPGLDLEGHVLEQRRGVDMSQTPETWGCVSTQNDHPQTLVVVW